MAKKNKKSKFQNAKPTQQAFGGTAVDHMSFAAKLRVTAGPDPALARQASAHGRLPGTLLRGEIQ